MTTSDANNNNPAPASPVETRDLASPPPSPAAAVRPPFTLTSDQVRTGLLPIMDPEIGISIVELGLIYGIGVDPEKRKITVKMTLTSMGCPVGPQILSGVEAMCRRMEGVDNVEVQLTFEPPWDPKVHCSEDAKAVLGIWE